ncbi:probable deoxyhypusine synthase [Coccinella septempunctata]|uniref:probable deoxyhypusine synthase n=1 Tax=Coccinella septempunctata TaxID=41139 RepID=UPI001D092150|nr:probable deoxyhypusine synthase [Coccinella septempunctata]
MAESIPDPLQEAVLKKTSDKTFLQEQVNGYDWNKGLDYSKILDSYLHSGFQATNFGKAVQEINRMIECRKQKIPSDKFIDAEDPFTIVSSNCTIFLGYTSNIVSSGLRETIRFLVQHKMVDCIVTTAGGVEEDLIKCLSPTFLGDFHLDGKTLREVGINRIGNLLVPNDNYCHFENWIMPILDEFLKKQKEEKILWSPSKVIYELGLRINNESSIYYWAAKNKIPVFSPALTDGSLGDMMFMHSIKSPGLVLDILSDLKRLNSMAMKAVNTGMIIIGGGLIKHHICNANLMRNGADFSVFINTASEYDGSDAGARPDEAKSWGKIKLGAEPVKIYAEATLVFPLLVGQTFAKDFFQDKSK